MLGGVKNSAFRMCQTEVTISLKQTAIHIQVNIYEPYANQKPKPTIGKQKINKEKGSQT